MLGYIFLVKLHRKIIILVNIILLVISVMYVNSYEDIIARTHTCLGFV